MKKKKDVVHKFFYTLENCSSCWGPQQESERRIACDLLCSLFALAVLCLFQSGLSLCRFHITYYEF
jgi:hypothetical protein